MAFHLPVPRLLAFLLPDLHLDRTPLQGQVRVASHLPVPRLLVHLDIHLAVWYPVLHRPEVMHPDLPLD
jgi:hypothetical protein